MPYQSMSTKRDSRFLCCLQRFFQRFFFDRWHSVFALLGSFPVQKTFRFHFIFHRNTVKIFLYLGNSVFFTQIPGCRRHTHFKIAVKGFFQRFRLAFRIRNCRCCHCRCRRLIFRLFLLTLSTSGQAQCQPQCYVYTNTPFSKSHNYLLFLHLVNENII